MEVELEAFLDVPRGPGSPLETVGLQLRGDRSQGLEGR